MTTEPDTTAEAALRSSVVWRAVTLLELLSGSSEGIGVREAARRTGIDRSAVSRILSQFEQLGCVQQEGERGVYGVGPRMFSIAAALRARDSLWKAAEPIVRSMVDRYNETCYLAVRHGDQVMFREKIDCDHRIRYVIELGKSFPLATGAAGTAILAGMPPEEADAVLARGFEQYTPNSFTTLNEYRDQVARDREQGYSVSVGRWVRNGGGIGSPYYDANGVCVGALTLSCPADRLEALSIEEVGQALARASAELSRRLGWFGSWRPGRG